MNARAVKGIIASPPKDKLAPDPALLLSIGGPATHLLPPNDQPAKYFWSRGHRVVSFDFEIMPWDLNEFREIILKGPDPIAEFITQAKAVLDYCIQQKWARQDRIVVTGISRFGYLGFRLMAADERLKIGAAFAPVTDWRDLSEFHNCVDRKEVIDLQLARFAPQLAGKKLYLSIGNHDERVNTLNCCRFFLDLNTENEKRGLGASLVDFLVTADVGHTCGDESFERGLETVLNAALKQEKK